MLTKALVHETVHHGIDGRVAVSKDLNKSHDDIHIELIVRGAEHKVDLAGKEGKPAESKQHHDDHEHAHHTAVLFDPAVSLSGMVSHSLPDGTSPPQDASYLGVGDQHGDYWEQVENHVEEYAVHQRLPLMEIRLHAEIGVLHIH